MNFNFDVSQEQIERMRESLIEKLPELEVEIDIKKTEYDKAFKQCIKTEKAIAKCKNQKEMASSKLEKKEFTTKLNDLKVEGKVQKENIKIAEKNLKEAENEYRKTKTAVRRPSRIDDMIRTGRKPTEY